MARAFLGGENSAWIKDGLLVTKGNLLFFFQNLSFFAMPLREQGVPRTSGAKTKQAGGIIRRDKSFDCVLNIDLCLSFSTS